MSWKKSCRVTKKLIAQTYDGASVMRGRIRGVHVKVKEVYENAYYVHCAAHQLNLVLSMAASCNREAKLFFAKLDKIPAFFPIHQKEDVQLRLMFLLVAKPDGTTTQKQFAKLQKQRTTYLRGLSILLKTLTVMDFLL